MSFKKSRRPWWWSCCCCCWMVICASAMLTAVRASDKRFFPKYSSFRSPAWWPPSAGTYGSSSCFDLSRNRIVLDQRPFHKLISRNVQDCQRLCQAMTAELIGCRAFLFDRRKAVCYFFDTSPTGAQAQYGAEGYDYYQLSPACSGQSTVTSTISTSTTGSTTISSQSSTGRSVTNGPSEGVCADGTLPLLEKVQDRTYRTANAVTIDDVSLQQCLQMCNSDQDGDGQEYFCLSGSYDADSRTCLLSVAAPPPTGVSGTLVTKTGATFFEKICVSSEIAALCPTGMLERFPQMVLVGLNEMMLSTADMEMCVELCIDSQVQFGFTCKSLIYYYEPKEDAENCILNYEDHRKEPDLFTEDTSQQVDYIAIHTCQNQAVRRDNPAILFIKEIRRLSLPTKLRLTVTKSNTDDDVATYTFKK